MRSGVFPNMWKSSYLLPLFKSGNKCDVNNYRGIAKLSCIPKLFEKIIYDCIELSCRQIISPSQHGFVKGRSTTTNLLEFVSEIIMKMQNGFQTDAVYIDFSKAFDRVNHNVLLYKLASMGFADWFIKWIQSYLTNRTQFVMFNETMSNVIPATSGVPQGSHLGPLLFVLFVNDLANVISYSRILMYADDVKLYLHYKDPHDSAQLQSDLNSLHNWSLQNDMAINFSKCKTMTFTRKKTLHINNYHLHNITLTNVEYICDLGIYMDRKLSFNKHMELTTSKARGMLGFICRWSREFKDPYILKTLYCSFVRPILEYGSSVWCPRYQDHIADIESVQKRFLIVALQYLHWNDPIRLPPYNQRLLLLNLPTLKKRRIISNVLLIFDLLNGNINSPNLLHKISINVNNRNSRYFDLLHIRFNRTNYGIFEPVLSLCKDFNKFNEYIDFNMKKDNVKLVLSNLRAEIFV